MIRNNLKEEGKSICTFSCSAIQLFLIIFLLIILACQPFIVRLFLPIVLTLISYYTLPRATFTDIWLGWGFRFSLLQELLLSELSVFFIGLLYNGSWRRRRSAGRIGSDNGFNRRAEFFKEGRHWNLEKKKWCDHEQRGSFFHSPFPHSSA